MNTINNQVINNIINIVKQTFEKEASGHDWWHIYRVWQTSLKIAEQEKADLFVVQAAALLHDIADWKFYNGNQDIGPQKAEEILKSLKVNQTVIDSIKDIIKNLSFKGAGVKHKKMPTLEGMIVQDADRLDALGAIGVARTFAYSGYKNRLIYDPNIKPVLHDNENNYVKNTSPAINHFYEKLLLLKDLMNTETGKKIAQERHNFMQTYLEQFYKEWNQEI
ncbi:MAG: Metal dependent phosphohydrolase [candidate division TM6 bacterium GW2011_GWF2_28_16]|nr:MAG: Metal dependent phosphohydrolase [candidate division TM6 bacterium GW2011_GWF2_28_16]